MKKASHLNILLFATIIMVLISGFITYLNSNERKDTQRMVLRGYEVIQSAERLFSFMKDMETGHRGYVISGDSSFLGSYEEGREALVLELDSVRNLVIDNPQQTNLFNNKIVPVIRNKSRSMEEGINIYNRHELDSAAAWISNKVGQTHMDTLRILIGSFIQNERALLSERREKLDWNTTIQDTIQFISFALVTVSITFAFFKLKQEKRTIDKLLSELETANRELELKVIERTKELEGANRDKDHFLAIASHDLKVPIAGILRLVELLKLEKQNHSAKDIEYLRYIEDSCNGMQHLISNLLDMNQIDQKKISIVPQKINLHDFLNRLEKNFDSQARKKNIELKIDKIEANINTDQHALSSVLENLISNALKFSPKGKSVYLKTYLEDGSVHFAVVDQGPGIAEDELPLLFKKFSRLTNKPTDNETSNGLGLAIAKELTDLLRGKILVTSRRGKGSTFTLVIPQ